MKKTFIFSLLLSLGLLFCLNIQSTQAREVSPNEEIGMERAKQIALKQVKGKIVRAKIETEDGMTKYEIIVQAKNGIYEVEIDKATGKVLEVEREGSGDDGVRDDDKPGNDNRNDN
ncbi:PepSY domain-containing protein [Bacillus methanolicus]|uniref:Putative secreted protein n=1 Tax=Bacillus methanolicus (strain MGA3 / ATCC 53907) TaxID=796606 RepID=I3E939_BACMM|nr:PepSY domain-containing protein [Bacillus methanolicus]AIE60266.1 putative secreted protein [Bacillus methanolicus MGA3]EIJ83010.1 peptidase domain protein [Bacillus methanolicus MGA3]UQD52256.1 hypothetical protein C0971_09680 [Bacillus methanolicus]